MVVVVVVALVAAAVTVVVVVAVVAVVAAVVVAAGEVVPREAPRSLWNLIVTKVSLLPMERRITC